MLATKMTSPTAAPVSNVMKGLVRFMSGGTQPRTERFHPARPFFRRLEGASQAEAPVPGAAGPGDQLVLWACPTRTRCPEDAGLPFACCRVTVIVGYWVGEPRTTM